MLSMSCKSKKGNPMKSKFKRMACYAATFIALSTMSGCGGYAQQSNGSSGVQVYGTVDAGISHGTR
jgi:hypothetical protein